MKKYFVKLLIFSLFITCFIYRSQEVKASDEIDSLKLLIKNQNDGIEKVDNLLKLSKCYYVIYMMDSAELAIQNTIQLSKKIRYLEGEADAYYRLSLIKYRTGDYNSAKDKISIFLSIAESLNDSVKLGKGFWLSGTLKKETGNHQDAIIDFKNSLLIFKEKQDSVRMLSVYQSLGNLFLNLSKFDTAAYYYHKTIEFCEATGNEKGVGIALSQLAMVYSSLPQPQYDVAREFLFRSLQISKKHNQLRSISESYSKLANIANNLHELDSALYYYGLAQKLNQQIDNMVGLIHNYNNIAEVYEKQERYDEALENYYIALKYYREQSIDEGIVVSLLNIADIYVNIKEYNLAHIYYDSSLNIATLGGFKNYQMYLLISKSQTYFNQEDYKSAYDYQARHYQLSESVFNLEKAEIIANLEMKYEKEKDQAQILALENENLAKDLSLRKRTNQRNIYLFTGIGIITSILFLFIFYHQKARKDKIIADQRIKQLEEEKKLLAAKYLVEGQDEERKRIAKELHDGLGVLLSTTKIQFSSIKDKSPENKEIIDKATKMLEQATGDVRKISHNMMPGLLTRYGLYEAAEEMIDQLNETEGLTATCEITGDTKRLPENKEIMMYRTIQEMVNNTLKHAGATLISLKVDVLPELLMLNYSDNGIGFNVEEMLKSKSIGLNSIQSRINFLGGTMDVLSDHDKGVSYTILIPKV